MALDDLQKQEILIGDQTTIDGYRFKTNYVVVNISDNIIYRATGDGFGSDAGILQAISGVGGGGSSTFIGLTDVPASFTGSGSKLVRVNAGATALEFVTGSTLFEAAGAVTAHVASGDPHTQYHTDARALTWIGTRSTTDLPEGTNLYYTAARFNTAFGTKSTSDLAEGSNLYYTSARFDTAFGTKSTSNLAEGSNLYYTTARWDTAFSTANLASLGTRDHGSLTGLTDDDHSIYALLAGRTGGQIIIGGTAAGDDLTLTATANASATASDIIFNSKASTEVGRMLGTTQAFLLGSATAGASAAKLEVTVASGTAFAIYSGSACAAFTSTHATSTFPALILNVATTYASVASLNAFRMDRSVNNNGATWGIDFTALTSGSSGCTYARIHGAIYDSTHSGAGYPANGGVEIHVTKFSSFGPGSGLSTFVGAKFRGDYFEINPNGFDYDVKFQSDGDANCFYLDGSANTVHIGSATTADSAKFYVVGKQSILGEFELNGDLNHDGTNVGFYSVTPTARPSAITQTYSTSDKTLGAYTSDPETVAYTGIDNLQVGSVYATVADLNILRTAYETLRVFTEDAVALLNAVVDDLQLQGLAQ